MRRVVVTGMGGVTALGDTWESIKAALKAGKSGVRRMPEWDIYPDLQTRLGVPVDDFEIPAQYPPKIGRSMCRVDLLGL